MVKCRHSKGGRRKRKFAIDENCGKEENEVKRNEITKLR